ncbi:plasmid mobilization relaxosome protein MobC [Taibaiella sp. KBW10]|uniref:plasmid mobilization protein n=1 Tax=Taibaiella sp. KBW10 TaxID=2153357 RepID=UPI000F5B05F7|nr:plasmid mobilization relaxosome protein MobC [Taibaiella sp. KBW10]RQO30401.1 plasmid mobilization relaxosome protein MobC [Taibaiella sp. KBW10]
MEEQKNIRNKWLHLRLNEGEYALLLQHFNKTTERQLSVYARKILLSKPMIASVRDEGLQDILVVLSKLQKDFNGVGNNYNQMIHKLHLMVALPEFRDWILRYEKEKLVLFSAIELIRDYVVKTGEVWLR